MIDRPGPPPGPAALHEGAGLAGLAPDNQEIQLAPPSSVESVLTLTIELRGSQPRVWRRLQLPGALTLDAVHTLLQAAMGWTDSHLHRFQVGAGHLQPYFVTAFDQEEGDRGTPEAHARLDQVLRAPGDELVYLYDFGDGWEHLLTLESLTASSGSGGEPRCLDGAGNCPPEDVGGIDAHHELADWLRAGSPEESVPEGFEDVHHALSWLPDGYDPDAFDAEQTTARMRVWARGEHLPWYSLPEPLADLVSRLYGEGGVTAHAWLADLEGSRRAVELDEDEARRGARPWSAVLDAVGPGVKLTAAGYLPPAIVERIANDAGIIDWWIGKANREDLTWPVATLRETAQSLGLLRKARGTLAPTARAKMATNQPHVLVASVLQRLPLGTRLASEAGWILLLGLAAGESGAPLHAGVANVLTARGWRTRDGSPVNARDARRAAGPTLAALGPMAGWHDTSDPALLMRLARATLFGVAGPG